MSYAYSGFSFVPLISTCCHVVEIDLIHAAARDRPRDRAPRVAVDVRAGDVDHLAAARRIVKLELLGLRIEHDDAALRLVADVPAAVSVGAHQRARAGRLERAFLRAIRPMPFFDFAGLRIEPADRVVVEVVEEDRAVGRDARVVRARRRGQIPRRIDDVGLFAFRPRHRLQLVAPHAVVQVDRRRRPRLGAFASPTARRLRRGPSAASRWPAVESASASCRPNRPCAA